MVGYRRLLVPGLLRIAAILLAFFVLLPQLRLAFDREGWPEIVILIDTSDSMGTEDDLKDPTIRDRAEQLAAYLASDRELANKIPLKKRERLLLARTLLTHTDGEWLFRLLQEKEVRVHLYALDKDIRLIGTLEGRATRSPLPSGSIAK